MNTAFRPPQPKPVFLMAFGLWILWGFGYQTLWKRLMTNVEGTVISAQDVPYPLAPARHGTDYTLRSPGGGNAHYIAGPTDASLPRSLPVGTYIKKKRWHFSYEQNGREIDDFSVSFYVAALSTAVGCLVWGFKLNRELQP